MECGAHQTTLNVLVAYVIGSISAQFHMRVAKSCVAATAIVGTYLSEMPVRDHELGAPFRRLDQPARQPYRLRISDVFARLGPKADSPIGYTPS